MEKTGIQRRLFRSIRARLIISFSLLFLLILASTKFLDIKGIPFTPYLGAQGQLKAEAVRGLNLIADLKKERLQRWIKERLDDANVVSDNYFTAASSVELLGIINNITAVDRKDVRQWNLLREKESYKNLLNYLEKVRTSYGGVYDRIHIADAKSGIIFISTDKNELGSNVSNHSCFQGSIKSHYQHIGDIKLSQQSHLPILDIGHVIMDKEGNIVAVLVIKINADDIIKPMLHTGEGLGERGEALLINRDVKILTSLKHQLPDGTTAKPLQYRIKAEPAVLAAKGEEGIIEAEDYRGEPVLAAYRYIPITQDWGWGMVVKRDKAELFAPLQQNRVYAFFIGLIGIFVFMVVTIILSKSLTSPIESLSHTAARVSGGDLDARAPVTTPDEVGALANTFNSMIERIQNCHDELEEKVKERTNELSKTNKEFKNEIAIRKKAEVELRKLSSAVEQSPVSIVITDTDSHIEYINPYFTKITGYSLEEALGKNSCILKSGEHPPGFYKQLWNTITAGNTWRGEFHNRKKSGELYWESASISPITDAEGNITHFVGIKVDITEGKQLVKTLGIAKEEAERANIAKSQFLSSMSHELRTPLNAILGFAELLESDQNQPLSASQADDIRQILISGQNLLHLINEILDLARIESGRSDISIESVDINPRIKNVINTIEPMAKKQSISLKYYLCKCASSFVMADPRCIEQILLNFLSNAVKYNKVDGSVTLSCKDIGNGFMRISVTDTGPGIPKDKHADLFEPFTRLGAEASDIEGTGIGLNIVKHLVNLMGGTVGVESTLGKGSHFYVDLLLAAKPVEEKRFLKQMDR